MVLDSIKNVISSYIKNDIFNDLKDVLIAFIIAFAFYKGSGLVLGTETPYLVVVSCSMLPELHRGDVIIVKGIEWEDIIANKKWKDPESTIIVYYEPLQNKLIVHRAYEKFERNGKRFLRAWGDNNSQPDPWIIPYENVKGEVVFKIPYLGYPRILLGYVLGQDVGGCERRIEVNVEG